MCCLSLSLLLSEQVDCTACLSALPLTKRTRLVCLSKDHVLSIGNHRDDVPRSGDGELLTPYRSDGCGSRAARTTSEGSDRPSSGGRTLQRNAGHKPYERLR